MRTFVFSDGSSNKFWSIDVQGAKHVVKFGKVGSAGQTQEKTFPTPDLAAAAADKLIREKTGKGYVEQVAAPPPSPERQALEAALVKNPDDLGAHAAYADYLTEQGDPRGEFIHAQLALEDESLPAAERKKWQKKEADLLKKHAHEWLGDAGRFLIGDWSGPDKPIGYTFARGWPDEVRLLPGPTAAVEAVAKSPEFRLLRKLEVVYDMRYHAFDFDQFLAGPTKALREDEGGGEMWDEMTTLPELAASPYLTNLRVLRYGFSDTDEDGLPRHSTMVQPFAGCTAKHVLDLLKKCPRLDELYLNVDVDKVKTLFESPVLGQLRVLQYYFATAEYGERSAAAAYPLAALASNPALKQLETLRLHPGRDATLDARQLSALVSSPNLPALRHLHAHMTEFGDEVYEGIAASGIFRRLKTLDLSFGRMTDDGARALAASPDLKKLDLLDVSRNALTAAGIKALKATGVRLLADQQYEGDEYDDTYWVDAE